MLAMRDIRLEVCGMLSSRVAVICASSPALSTSSQRPHSSAQTTRISYPLSRSAVSMSTEVSTALKRRLSSSAGSKSTGILTSALRVTSQSAIASSPRVSLLTTRGLPTGYSWLATSRSGYASRKQRASAGTGLAPVSSRKSAASTMFSAEKCTGQAAQPRAAFASTISRSPRKAAMSQEGKMRASAAWCASAASESACAAAAAASSAAAALSSAETTSSGTSTQTPPQNSQYSEKSVAGAKRARSTKATRLPSLESSVFSEMRVQPLPASSMTCRVSKKEL
ncbi:PP140 [Orf virus]|uniref:PP140 n=1 Tax=Orf virus TaxID=10258 RepID=F1AWV0_ORFV|nr:PP140 [Orf virus]